MLLKLRSIWNELVSSFWFIPLLFILFAFGGAYAMIYLDTSIAVNPTGFFRNAFPSNVDSARSVLSTISGAMIGVAGTVFSITLVALTLATSQFGSRLLRNFMHDRTNQVVLGSYISTFVYCLLVLNAVDSGNGKEFVLELSVFIAIVAAVINIIMLIVFIHHISTGIQADRVISDISTSLNNNLRTIFPDDLEENGTQIDDVDLGALREDYDFKNVIKSPKGGYLQYLEHETILSTAIDADLLIFIKFRPGDHLVRGSEVMEIFSRGELSDKSIRRLETAFLLGNVRTPYQDAEFSIHQMVEIAARALSPGVNDPYTAIVCIDNLTSSLCQLTGVKFPFPCLRDEKGTVRVVADVLTFEGMLSAAFNQIRQFAGGSPSVTIRLMESLVTIHHFVRTEQQKQAVQKHMRMVLRMAERSFTEENDLTDLKERIKALI